MRSAERCVLYDLSYLDLRLPASHQQLLIHMYCLYDPSYLTMLIPAIHQQLPIPIYCTAALQDPSYLDMRLPAIYQQLRAPYAVLYCVYSMASATWICASQPAISSCLMHMYCYTI